LPASSSRRRAGRSRRTRPPPPATASRKYPARRRPRQRRKSARRRRKRSRRTPRAATAAHLATQIHTSNPRRRSAPGLFRVVRPLCWIFLSFCSFLVLIGGLPLSLPAFSTAFKHIPQVNNSALTLVYVHYLIANGKNAGHYPCSYCYKCIVLNYVMWIKVFYILLYSILFYSMLFYSILFYSILFHLFCTFLVFTD
jgi:hypothetical protein